MPIFVGNKNGEGGSIEGTKLDESEVNEAADEMAEHGYCARVAHNRDPRQSLKAVVERIAARLADDRKELDKRWLLGEAGNFVEAVQGCVGLFGPIPKSGAGAQEPTPMESGLSDAGGAAGEIKSKNLAEAYNAKVDGPDLSRRSESLSHWYRFRRIMNDGSALASTYIVPASQSVVADTRLVWNAVKDVPEGGLLTSLAGPMRDYFAPLVQKGQDTRKKVGKATKRAVDKVTAALGPKAEAQAQVAVRKQVSDVLQGLLMDGSKNSQ